MYSFCDENIQDGISKGPSDSRPLFVGVEVRHIRSSPCLSYPCSNHSRRNRGIIEVGQVGKGIPNLTG